MNRQAEGFEGTEAKSQIAENSNNGSNFDSVRAEAFGPQDRTPQGQNSENKVQVTDAEVRAHFQKQMELTLDETTKIGPVKKGQGYFQVLKDTYPALKDEEASKEAKRIKKLSDSRDVLKVGEMLPTLSPDTKQKMMDRLMSDWDKGVADRKAREKVEADRQAAEKAEQQRVAAEKAEQERVATETAEQEKAAAAKAEQEKAAAEKAEQEKVAAEKAEQERAATEKAEQEKAVAEKAEQEKATAEKAEQERIAAEQKEQAGKPGVDFNKLNVDPQRAVPKLPDEQSNEKPAAPKEEPKAKTDEECGSMAELGRNILGGGVTGLGVGAAFSGGPGAIPGAIIGGAGGAALWYYEKGECEAAKK